MEIKELEQILKILRDNEVSEFEYEEGATKIKLSRGFLTAAAASQPMFTTEIRPAAVQVAPNAAAPAAGRSDGGAAEIPSHFVKVESPIVGTFYKKPSPDADPFVSEGTVVKKGQTLCIIEAMKVMNEIEAPVGGKVEKIFLTDGKVVEFGEVLFLINPNA